MIRDPSLIPLSHDHQHALALCVQIRRELGDVMRPAIAVQRLRELVLSHFESEMRGHFACEETIVFPVLAAVDETRPLVSELLGEHRRIAELVDAIRIEPDARLLAAFAELLTQHVRKEERGLFEEMQRSLPREELDGIGAAVLASRGRSL
ncbi:MAG TPA: hemerythrin domain-containing protein [Bryobacteraceae bacterium]|nr:hemerythrin domain-containing protein [Bryobacteraceae bacterium]